MDNLLGRFGSQFTCDEFPRGMFYHFDAGLRFALGGEGNQTWRPIKRFIRAFERADVVSSNLFGEARSRWLLSASYSGQLPNTRRLKTFALCGLDENSFTYLGAMPQRDEEHIAEFGSDIVRHWDAVELHSHTQMREVLWLALGAELQIEPNVKTDIYIVDFDRSIALNPYDDRGMDVVSMSKEHLIDLYRDYKAWLLDYDISRMEAVFERN